MVDADASNALKALKDAVIVIDLSTDTKAADSFIKKTTLVYKSAPDDKEKAIIRNKIDDALYQYGMELFQNVDDVSNKRKLEALRYIHEQLQGIWQSASPKKVSWFVPYPSTEDVEFSIKIANKKEFRKQLYIRPTKEYEDIVDERCSNSTFNLTENQKMLKHFMSPITPYNSLLVFHKVGTGKTCTAISIAEQFIPLYKKRVLVILNKNITSNFKNQIFDVTKVAMVNKLFTNKSNQCTGTRYLDMVPEIETLTADNLTAKVKKLIKQRYEFMGFERFAKFFETLETKAGDITHVRYEERLNRLIKAEFSDRVVIIDEVHNLRLNQGDMKKKVPPKVEHMLRIADNIKLLLLTATPMFNSATEIVWLLNYLLLNDKQTPIKINDVISKRGTVTKSGKEVLKRMSRGRVSFMQGDNPYTFPFRLLPSINGDAMVFTENDKPTRDINGNTINPGASELEKLGLLKSYMSDFQQKVYLSMMTKFENVKDNANAKLDDAGDVENNKHVRLGTQISNVVYPVMNDSTKCYGKSGFEKCLREEKTGKQTKENKQKQQTRYAYKDMNHQVFSAENIGTYAPKLKSIVDYILNSEGIVFVYSSFVTDGVLPLAMALEHHGFNKYKGAGGTNLLKDVDGLEKKSANKFNYILLTSREDISPNNNNEIDRAKRDDNKDGDKIKVILGTDVIAEGIDFKCIREIHILEPWYHLNKIEQVIGRGARNCSHIELPLKERNVTIYKHVNMIKGKTDIETSDVRVYRIADEKQSQIRLVEDILKKNSVDCWLNREAMHHPASAIDKKIILRTSQKKDVEYTIGSSRNSTPQCYPKNHVLSPHVDNSTFNLAFLKDDVDIYISFIAPMFDGPKLFFSYPQIHEYIKERKSNYDEEILKYSLHTMLTERISIISKRLGRGYLIYRSNKYIFQKEDDMNLRLTLEERENVAYKSKGKKLNVAFFNRLGKSEQPIQEEGKIYRELQTSIDRLKGLVPINEPEFDDAILDFVVDRLSQQDTMVVVTGLFKLAHATGMHQQVLQSLMRTYVFHPSDATKKNDFGLYIDKYMNKLPSSTDDSVKSPFYVYVNNQLMQCPAILIKNAERKVESARKACRERLKNLQQLTGFVTLKNNKIVFKLMSKDEDGKATSNIAGSVCGPACGKEKLHELILNEIPKSLQTDDVLKKIEKMDKSKLCDFLEVLLRKHGNKFARPFQHTLLKAVQA